jgi:hypothetical protein
MPRYVVERTFPDELIIPMDETGAQTCHTVVSNNAQDQVTWVHSYVSEDKQKTYCIYDGPSPEAIRQAARRSNLPIDRITEVRVLDPYFYQ